LGRAVTVRDVVVVEDTGHHIEVDQPARVVDEVLSLLP
jgi:hypothetical protein